MAKPIPDLRRRLWTLLQGLLLCAGFAAVVLAIFSYVHYATNVPYTDDYQTSLEFLVKFHDSASFIDSTALLLHRHSSHITLFPNLVNILDWKIFGNVNMRHLVMVAMLFLLAMTLLLQKMLLQNMLLQTQGAALDKSLRVMTLALLCINCLTYSSGLWSITSLQNYPVLFFIALALLLLAKPGGLRVAAAALLMTLATFSSGNGMFGFVAGAALLLITRRYQTAGIWSVVGIATVVGFFHIFNTHEGYELATGLKQGPVPLLAYYLAFLGSVVQVLPVYGELLAPIVGAAILVACLWLLKKKYPQQNPVIASWILFLLLTAGVVTLARFGIAYSGPLASRYAINSCVLVALLYVAFTEVYGHRIKRWHLVAICLIALLFNVQALRLWLPAMYERQQRLLAGAEAYVRVGDIRRLTSRTPERAQLALEAAADRHIYHMASALGQEAPYKVPPRKILAVVTPAPP